MIQDLCLKRKKTISREDVNFLSSRDHKEIVSTIWDRSINTMFDIGDRVVNSTTGHRGQVIGYGHQILSYGYMPTLKVLLKEGTVEEDLYSVWTEC